MHVGLIIESEHFEKLEKNAFRIISSMNKNYASQEKVQNYVWKFC